MRRRVRRPASPRSLLISLLVILVAFIISRLEHPTTPSWQTESPTEAPVGAFVGKVVAVSDGDTIRVLYKNREVKVRLFGVDAPEKRQAYGTAAKQFTSNMVFDETVTVTPESTDRYGRTVAWVKTQDGRVLNAELVRAGMAWWYRDYDPNDSRLAKLEDQAQAARRGLWAARNPEPPWEFRKMERARRLR